MTKLVQQRDDKSCVIASLAMYTGLSYEEIEANVVRHPLGGVNLGSALACLHKVGHVDARRSVEWYSAFPAIMDVPSINNVGYMHAVYWDGERIYDPQEGRDGKLFWTTELMQFRMGWGSTITEAPA